MEETRTFGIEIEARSNLSNKDLASKINNALTVHGHSCIRQGYGHNIDGTNFTRWEIQYDTSINTTRTHQHQTEIVSPVLKGQHGLDMLKIVLNIVQENLTVNQSCGLHVHHAVKANEARNIRTLINNWIDFEDAFFSILPASRHNQYYCRKYQQFGASKMIASQNLRQWWRHNIGTRYCSLNMESYWVRGTVEFRLHSATTEYEKISNWVIATQQFVAKSLNGKTHDDNSFNGLMTFLKENEASFKKCRKGSIRRTVQNMVLLGAYEAQIIQALMNAHNLTEAKATKVMTERVRNLTKKKFGGLQVTNINGYIKGTPVNSTENNDAIETACDWMNQRHEHFTGIRG